MKQKNQQLLIKAFSQIANEFEGYQLHIYGQGELKQELEKLINDLGLENKVFLKGVMKNAIMENRDASLFVMSSDYEGFPNTLVEAMANGIPSISTDFNTKSARELFKDESCGWLVNVSDENDLAQKMRLVLSDESDLNDKSKNGLYVRDMLNSNKICDQWLEEIRMAIS